MIRRAIRSIVRRSKSLEPIAGTMYDTENAQEFSDLFEHEKMLADSVRVETYASAIRRHVGPGDVVVDVGTGTGVLAILAARQGAKVYAIDHSEIIELAEEIAIQNDVDTIQFEQVNSKEFESPEPVDILIHEIIGDDLLDENMLEYLSDLRRRILREEGRILPGRFDLFFEPVTLREDHRVPYLSRVSVDGIDLTFLAGNSIIDQYKPHGYEYYFIEDGGFESYLASPEPVLTIDLNAANGGKNLPQEVSVSRTVENSGMFDGLVLYFSAHFDDELAFDTAPHGPGSHWGNRIFRSPSRYYEEGEEIRYTIEITDSRRPKRWEIDWEE